MTVQIIDEHKHFNGDLGPSLEAVDATNDGLNYHIVSVFGSQSTGKSTLLNALFGTKFQVMSEAQRSQTTKGIWMGRAITDENASDEVLSSGSASSDEFVDLAPRQPSPAPVLTSSSVPPAILVLDVEGTDGRERGEDQDFERRSALFALATSEVLLINMWESQVGLYQGANMGLLKTVFEVNLTLFQSSGQAPRSLILFVIRDHLGTTPLANLTQTVLADLDNHWKSISKPEKFQDSTIHDFFDIQFFPLPHKILQADLFTSEVARLATRFNNEANSQYVFRPEYHRKVPIDGWPIYAKQIWDQIELNKDLDLPTQQLLVARFRCQELATEATNKFEAQLAEFKESPEGASLGSNTVVSSFGTVIGAARSAALDHYDSTASRYHATAYSDHRKTLQSQVDARIDKLYIAQLTALHRTALAGFRSLVAQAPANAGSSFAGTVAEAKKTSLAVFVEGAKSATVDESAFSYDEHLATFKSELDASSSELMVSYLNRKISRELGDKLGSFFSTPSEGMWSDVLAFFESTVESNLRPFLVGSPEIKSEIPAIRRSAWQSLDSRLKDVTSDKEVIAILVEAFEKAFRYDKNEVPIIWKPSDDIEGQYLKARETAGELLPILATVKDDNGELVEPDVSGADIDNFAVRIPDHRQKDILAKFRLKTDTIYTDAKRSINASSAHVPFYMIVLVVVLGWNEFMAVLRNPFLLLFAILAAGGAYISYSLDLWGPILSIINVVGGKTFEITKERLRQALEVPHHTETAGSTSKSQTDSEPIHHRSIPGSVPGDIPLEDFDFSESQ